MHKRAKASAQAGRHALPGGLHQKPAGLHPVAAGPKETTRPDGQPTWRRSHVGGPAAAAVIEAAEGRRHGARHIQQERQVEGRARQAGQAGVQADGEEDVAGLAARGGLLSWRHLSKWVCGHCC